MTEVSTATRPDAGRPADLLLRHGRVITMDPDRRVLPDGTIAITGGTLSWIGPDHEWHGTATASRDLRGAVVHPGLVDAHVHTITDGIRGFAPKGDGDWDDVEAAVFDTADAQAERLSALLSCMEMLVSGTTTYADTGGSLHLDAVADAVAEVGMRGMPGWFVVDDDTDPALAPLARSTADGLARLDDQLLRYAWTPDARVRAAVTLAGMGLASDALLQGAAARAQARGVPMIMHQSWDASEVTSSLARHGVRPIEHLADLGILGPHLTLVHMIHLDDREVELVAESGTRVVHCPSASMRRAKGALRVGRFPELHDAGVTIALGSDGLSGPRDLLRQAYLVAAGWREVRGEEPTFTAEDALEMATIHGARALGMHDEIGSLEVGKRADLVIHATGTPMAHPRFDDPVDWLVFYAGSRTVATVLVDGQPVVEEGRPTQVDVATVLDAVDRQAAGYEAALGADRFARWPLVR